MSANAPVRLRGRSPAAASRPARAARPRARRTPRASPRTSSAPSVWTPNCWRVPGRTSAAWIESVRAGGWRSVKLRLIRRCWWARRRTGLTGRGAHERQRRAGRAAADLQLAMQQAVRVVADSRGSAPPFRRPFERVNNGHLQAPDQHVAAVEVTTRGCAAGTPATARRREPQVTLSSVVSGPPCTTPPARRAGSRAPGTTTSTVRRSRAPPRRAR